MMNFSSRIIVFGFMGGLFALYSCIKNDVSEIDEGDGIEINFLEGLNDNPTYQLSRDENGFYELTLSRSSNQTIQRITAQLTRNGAPVIDMYSGSQPKMVHWESNLFWWLKEGQIVAEITKTYINYFTGELTYINLPPLINWQDVLVPTINHSSYTEEATGKANTVIAPILEMAGDTLKVKVMYTHTITERRGDGHLNLLGERVFKDSTYIVLK